MEVTKIDNQANTLKEKVKLFFIQSIALRKKSGNCMVKDELAMILDKWSLFILYNLGYYEVMRFSELKNKITGVSSRMLSVTLKKLEKKKVIKRKVYAAVPPKVEYRLTDYGKELTEKALELNQWFLNKHT